MLIRRWTVQTLLGLTRRVQRAASSPGRVSTRLVWRRAPCPSAASRSAVSSTTARCTPPAVAPAEHRHDLVADPRPRPRPGVLASSQARPAVHRPGPSRALTPW